MGFDVIAEAVRSIAEANPERSAQQIADEHARMLVHLVNATKPKQPVTFEGLVPVIVSCVEAYRQKQSVLTGSEAEFDTAWIDSLNRENWKCWKSLRTYLLRHRIPTRSLASVSSLDSASDRILRLVGPPGFKGQRMGLVLGYIQSGKTENFTSLVSKAADCGYKLIIVLSGVDDEIRRQTQVRFEQCVFGVDSEPGPDGVAFPEPRWIQFTNKDRDFQSTVGSKQLLTSGAPCALVIKKNKTVLKRVIEWLDDAGKEVLKDIPTLVIDDEADQASPTTSNRVDDPTAINKAIRTLLRKCPRSRYVAYTATPFANFFMNSRRVRGEFGDDLYPSDFILSLPVPSGYLGTADIYGLPSGVLRSGQVVQPAKITRLIADERDLLKNMGDNDPVPDGLSKAIASYLISSAVAMLEAKDESIPCSMLVHVSQLNEEHKVYGKVVERALVDLAGMVLSSSRKEAAKQSFLSLYREDFLSTHAQVIATGQYEIPSSMPTFEDVWPVIVDHLLRKKIEVRVVNSLNESAPSYEGRNAVDGSLKGILVGGNLLSRGLTIPNLFCSYFLREPGQADTLLQMARWLGYRRQYAHLLRVFSTDDCHSDLEEISGAEQDIRNQIDDMHAQGKTPRDFAVRVKIRAGLMPTRRSAMRGVAISDTSTNFSGALLETRCFPEDEPEWLRDATTHNARLIERSVSGIQPEAVPDTNWRRYAIGRDKAIGLIRSLKVHREDPQFRMPLNFSVQTELLDYIERRKADSELTEWELVVCQLERKARCEVVSVPGLGDIIPMERGRETRGPSTRLQRISNLGEGRDEFYACTTEQRSLIVSKGIGESNGAQVRQFRNPALGRIFVYPISRDSNRSSKGNRVPLFSDKHHKDAPEYLLGFAISLPGSSKAIEQSARQYINATIDTRP